jgi:hypothetical protein
MRKNLKSLATFLRIVKNLIHFVHDHKVEQKVGPEKTSRARPWADIDVFQWA